MSGLDDLFASSPRTLSPSEVASLLGVTKQAVYRWLTDGIIPGYKLGSMWLIPRDELKATMQKGSNLPDES